jgi:hypothetical protein
MIRKSIFVLLILKFFIQSNGVAQSAEKDKSNTNKNIFKINLFALGLKSISGQYERSIGKKTSFSVGFRYMPKGDIPFKNAIINAVDDEEAEEQIENFKTGNFAFTPEIRFYMGRKNSFRGFYIAPYVRIARYTNDLLYEYDDGGIDKTIPMSGPINTITGGLLFGAQWKLGKRLYLDWWLFGPNYGSSEGTFEGKKSLTSSEQEALRNDLNDLDFPRTKIDYTVDANGAVVNFNGPWAGIRTGLCLGIRF